LISEGEYLLILNGKVLTNEEASRFVMIDNKIVWLNPLYLSSGVHKIRLIGEGELKIVYAK
jgi:hypothetical protein